MTRLASLFILPFFIAGCVRKPLISGNALKEKIASYLQRPGPPPDFRADAGEALSLVREALVPGAGARKGQDTVFLKGTDGKKRALGLHVPVDYTPVKPVPLLIWLHGGVHGTRQHRGAEVAHYFARESDSCYFIFAAVSGEQGATWFDETGIKNILESLEYIRSHYNIDDDRVFLAGVSDGGSACYVSGSLYPDNFAGYIVCSGSPGLARVLGLPFLPVNMKLRKWFVIHGGRDRLYPGEAVQPVIEGLAGQGVAVQFHYYENLGHGLDYMPMEKPHVLRFIREARRDPCPDGLVFECVVPMRVSWLRADVLIGNTTVRPARISARKSGTRVDVTSQRVRAFSLYCVPPLFRPGEKIEVFLNGERLGSRTCRPDLAFLLNFAARTRDKSFVPFCRLEFTAG
jgi:predicted esterase